MPPYLHALDYAASFMWQAYNSERAGAHNDHVKALERTGLNLGSFSTLVFCTSNKTQVHKPDTPRLVSKWRADGHLTGTTFGSSEEDQPEVVKRHLLESKSPALYSEQGGGACELHPGKRRRLRPTELLRIIFYTGFSAEFVSMSSWT